MDPHAAGRTARSLEILNRTVMVATHPEHTEQDTADIIHNIGVAARVVLGGMKYEKPVLVTDQVLADLGTEILIDLDDLRGGQQRQARDQRRCVRGSSGSRSGWPRC